MNVDVDSDLDYMAGMYPSCYVACVYSSCYMAGMYPSCYMASMYPSCYMAGRYPSYCVESTLIYYLILLPCKEGSLYWNSKELKGIFLNLISAYQ